MKITSISLLIAFSAALFSFLQFEKTQNALQNAHQNLLQLEDELGSKIDTLRKQRPLAQTPDTLNHLEADHLSRFEIELFIHLASTQLQTAKDPALSLELLKDAQHTLQALHDPKLDLLSKALEQDVQVLTTLKQDNVQTTWKTITALIDETQDLQPRHRPTTEPAVTPSASATPPAPVSHTNWKALVYGVLESLKDLIKVQRHTKPIEPLLSQTEQTLAQQQLRLLLEQWRLSVLMVDQVLYNRLAQDIQQWVDHYYDPKDPKVLSLEQSLNTLKGLSLKNTYPPLKCLDHLSVLRS